MMNGFCNFYKGFDTTETNFQHVLVESCNIIYSGQVCSIDLNHLIGLIEVS
jgi:hypothetical protein